MLQTFQLLTLLAGARLERARDDERGASAVEWVIITALLVGIASAVGLIILNTLQDGANSIDLGI